MQRLAPCVTPVFNFEVADDHSYVANGLVVHNCDLYARANLHGLGQGVYPRGAHPYPAHPMTLSYLVAVFVEEITAEDRAGATTPFAWLRTQPASVQTGVLGGQRKQQAFEAGQLLPSELRAPWRDIRTRLGQ